MTRLEEMAKAGYEEWDRECCRRFGGARVTWQERGPEVQKRWLAQERAAVERLIEIDTPVVTTDFMEYLRSILTEHDRETTEPPRPSRPLERSRGDEP